MNEYTARESTILGILRNQYAMFNRNEQPMTAYNYSAIDWDELTALAIVASEYVAYIPPNPKGNPMYETGKHVILPAIMKLPENIGKIVASEVASEAPKSTRVLIERGSIFQAPKFGTGDKVLYYGELFWVLSADLVNGIYAYQLQDTDGEIIGALIAESEIESPVQDSLVSVPDILAEHHNQVEQLEARIANDAAYMTSLEKKNEKLEADLTAAQAIIVQAGAMVEKKSHGLLDAIEANVQLKQAMRDVIDSMNNTLSFNEGTSAIGLKRMREVLAKALVDSTSEESPDAAQAVTLSEDEINGLASRLGTNDNFNFFISPNQGIGDEILTKVYRASETRMRLTVEYDTPANRQAIEARRTTLAQS